EGGGQVGGDGGHVEFPLDDLAQDFVCGARQGEFIAVGGGTLGGVVHQLHYPHGGVAPEGGHLHGDPGGLGGGLLGGGAFRLGGAFLGGGRQGGAGGGGGFPAGAGPQGEGQGKCQKEGNQLSHGFRTPFPFGQDRWSFLPAGS